MFLKWHLWRLRSRKVWVRQRAVRALGKMRSRKALDALVTVLKDEDPFVRVRVAWALRENASREALDTLVPMLNDKKHWVRDAASRALRELKWKPETLEEQASDSLARSNLGHDDYVRIAQIGQPALAILLAILQDKDHDSRETAVEVLRRMGSCEAIRALNDALNDSDRVLRSRAAYALAEIGPAAKECVPRLVAALSEGLLDKAAVRALGRIKSPAKDAVPLLVAGLNDEKEEYVSECAKALAGIGVIEAIPSLVKALHHQSKWVRENVAESLHALGWKPREMEERILYFMARGECGALVSIGDPAVPALAGSIANFDYIFPFQPIDVLREIGTKEAVAALADVMHWGVEKNKSEPVAATRALRAIGSEDAILELMLAAYNAQWNVMEAAGEALRYLKKARPKDYTSAEYIWEMARDHISELHQSVTEQQLRRSIAVVRKK